MLRHVFERVIIPEAVAAEVAQGFEARGSSGIDLPEWLERQSSRREPDRLLTRSLDSGEAAVVALAVEIGADWVLIDERKGRKIASEIYGLRVIGTAGLLVRAKQLDLVASVLPALNAMRNNGYWLHDSLVKWAQEKAEE